MMAQSFVLGSLLAYLLGSIPTGLLFGKAKGIDLRQHGSGNIGATNALRYLGKPIGFSVLLLDVLKGFSGVMLGKMLFALPSPQAADPTWQGLFLVCLGLAAILGHNYPVWLKFSGGKGIATSAGVLLALFPAAIPLCLVVWLGFFLTTHYVSLASISAALSLPMIVAGWQYWQGTWNLPLLGFSLLIAILAVIRHRSNIKRLLTGVEDKTYWFKKTEISPEVD